MTDNQRFTELCRDEAESLSRLSVLLEQEFAILDGEDMPAVESVALEKAVVLQEVQEKSLVRAEWMKAQSIYSADSVAAWLAGRDEAAAAWAELDAALSRAHALNERNGAIINRRLERTSDALAFLKSCASATLGYGKDGTTPDVPVGGRHLGSA